MFFYFQKMITFLRIHRTNSYELTTSWNTYEFLCDQGEYNCMFVAFRCHYVGTHCASLYLPACLKNYSTMCRHESLKAFYREKAKTSSKHGPDLCYIYSTRMDFNICWKSLELLSALRRQPNFCWRFVLSCAIVYVCAKCGVKFVLRVAATVGIRGSWEETPVITAFPINLLEGKCEIKTVCKKNTTLCYGEAPVVSGTFDLPPY